MQYPLHLLPRSNYRLIEWAEWLEERHLLRHTPDSNLIEPETGKLKLDYIVPESGSSQLRDFSTNLLGSFLPEDRFCAIKKESKHLFFKLWIPGEEVEEPLFNQDFEKDENRGMFFLRIGDIVGLEVPYTIGGQENFNVICKVIHTPNRANFWHFSVRWFNKDGDIYPDQRGNWIDRMLKTSVKTLIQEYAKFDSPSTSPIEEIYYIIHSKQEED